MYIPLGVTALPPTVITEIHVMLVSYLQKLFAINCYSKDEYSVSLSEASLSN